jgi:hypothetical protein
VQAVSQAGSPAVVNEPTDSARARAHLQKSLQLAPPWLGRRRRVELVHRLLHKRDDRVVSLHRRQERARGGAARRATFVHE